jgi:hypothetical protein
MPEVQDPYPKSGLDSNKGETIMNAKTRKLAMLVAVLTICLFSMQQASAQSPLSACKKIKGNSLQVFDPATGVVSGPVTNAGVLNGTLEDVINFAAGFALTPDPNVFAYTTDFTITTIHGQLKANPVTIQHGTTGSGAEWGHINSNASTGRFAGATGFILVSFKPVGDPSVGPYEAEITGEICYAHDPL